MGTFGNWTYSVAYSSREVYVHIPELPYKLPDKLFYRHDCEQDQQRWAQNQQCGS